MNFYFFILCVATLSFSSLHRIPFNSTTCDEDKLGKLITGTHQITQPTQILKSDCINFMHVTVTAPSCTKYTTKTVTLRTQSAPQNHGEKTEAPYEIPDAYKSAYSSSVCSSLGITPDTTTVSALVSSSPSRQINVLTNLANHYDYY